MTISEAIPILQNMVTGRVGTDDLDTTIRMAREKEAVDLAVDALKDIKPIKPVPAHTQIESNVSVVFKYSCGNCGSYVREVWKACPICGRKVKWDET